MSEEAAGSSEGIRRQFGNRILTDDEDVFKYNAWDHVEWGEEQEQEAEEKIRRQAEQKMDPVEREKFLKEAEKYWNSFYDIHESRFFKDRQWILTEFPDLAPKQGPQLPCKIFEIGCGVGNTLLPILKANTNPLLKVYGGDFSERAVELFRNHPNFDKKRCEAFVFDATLVNWNDQLPFEENSLDFIILIFTLSAIAPDKMQLIAHNCYRYLREGGKLLFRDYGRYDMAQLRFKVGRCIQDNLYVRGDGTMAYFFKQEEVHRLFTKAGFVVESGFVDRRMQVNRGRKVQMYRVWVQTKFKKLPFAVNSVVV